MTDLNNTLDFSNYLLCEETGDSEADCDPNMPEHAYKIDRADDDAQSCSHDASEPCNAVEDKGLHESCKADDDKKEDVHGTSYCEDDEIQDQHKSCVSVDSGLELMDEMEKNRLFWEACLES